VLWLGAMVSMRRSAIEKFSYANLNENLIAEALGEPVNESNSPGCGRMTGYPEMTNPHSLTNFYLCRLVEPSSADWSNSPVGA
jgi:hypothetical protein